MIPLATAGQHHHDMCLSNSWFLSSPHTTTPSCATTLPVAVNHHPDELTQFMLQLQADCANTATTAAAAATAHTPPHDPPTPGWLRDTAPVLPSLDDDDLIGMHTEWPMETDGDDDLLLAYQLEGFTGNDDGSALLDADLISMTHAGDQATTSAVRSPAASEILSSFSAISALSTTSAPHAPVSEHGHPLFAELSADEIMSMPYERLMRWAAARKLNGAAVEELKDLRKRLKNRHSAKKCSSQKQKRSDQVAVDNGRLLARVRTLEATNQHLQLENAELRRAHQDALRSGSGTRAELEQMKQYAQKMLVYIQQKEAAVAVATTTPLPPVPGCNISETTATAA